MSDSSAKRRFLVSEVRSYTERWLIEADSPEEARQLGGTIIDHDPGSGSDEGQSIAVDEVSADQEEL